MDIYPESESDTESDVSRMVEESIMIDSKDLILNCIRSTLGKRPVYGLTDTDILREYEQNSDWSKNEHTNLF